ncbi:MAG TPA: hypothetical protein VFT90_03330, partial [Chryseosolibacter sp.]|nr:hypothetical protein [Chryseosolibacter sp.]
MKAKITMLIIALATPAKQYAQTAVNETITVSGGQTIDIHFDYPELITVTTWDKNEISIQGQVSINEGENDDAFKLVNTTSGNVIHIKGTIENLKNLPHRITVMRDGQKIMFRDKSEWQKYKAEHGGGYNSMSMGPDIDIRLEIKVPKNTATKLTSVYGMVEVKDFAGPLTVDATYGGVDVALRERAVGELTAETNFGEIYSNLNADFDGKATHEAFHTFVSAKPGEGPRYNFESKYGNVYL